ncbi:MAG: hypothetical protein QOI74_834 [Micromonosporaceae bacterium]|jgi:uncharacterized protein YkwD|nr:hypothetical protein [Micromonosporaceae bacterium]
MHGVDPWAQSAPLYDGAPQYGEPLTHGRPAGYDEPTDPRFDRPATGYPPLRYSPPDYAPPGYTASGYRPTDGYGDGYLEDLDQPGPSGRRTAGQRMRPIAISGTIAAILISIGLILALLSPALSGKTSARTPNLPGVLDTPPVGTLAPQPAPQVPVDSPEPSGEQSAPPTTAPPADGNAAAENAVVTLVNNERRAARCDPVQVDPRLAEAARQHSIDMATGGFLSHQGSDGSSANDRMRAAGFNAPLSETIARGFTSSRDVVRAWLRSRADRSRIVDCDAGSVGVSVVVANDGTPYWTQNFGQ